MTVFRRREYSWRSPSIVAAASRAAHTASIGDADPGAFSSAATTLSCSAVEPAKSTSRLSAKYRKNVRAVRPARSAISATVVCSNPRST